MKIFSKMTDSQAMQAMQRMLKMYFYAKKLDFIDTNKNEGEREALLKLEPDFQRAVSKLQDYEGSGAILTYLVFVANKKEYTLEEQIEIRKSLLKDLDKEIEDFTNGNT